MSTPHTSPIKDVAGKDGDEELSRREGRKFEGKKRLVLLVISAKSESGTMTLKRCSRENLVESSGIRGDMKGNLELGGGSGDKAIKRRRHITC